jgi:glycosyltransferase involved in cell wall biosynthesis
MPEAPLSCDVRHWPGSSTALVDISVLMPCWHAEDTIGDALDAVEAQEDLPPSIGVELVVVIDGRLEDQRAVHRWLARRAATRRWPLTLITLHSNAGAGAARMEGYSYCHGQFLAFLDDDDLWHPRKLALQWRWHQANPTRIASSHGYEAEPREHVVGFLWLLIGGARLPTPTLMICRALWPNEPEPYRYGEDWLMLAMIASRQPVHVLPYNLAWRSPAAPPPLLDVYSLSRQRAMLRLGKISGIWILCQRGVLSPIWMPVLLVWNGLLAMRRWVLDFRSRSQETAF